jgi:hypothetical protein
MESNDSFRLIPYGDVDRIVFNLILVITAIGYALGGY